jgi:hypothetical protein
MMFFKLNIVSDKKFLLFFRNGRSKKFFEIFSLKNFSVSKTDADMGQWCHDTQHKDTQHKDTQHKGTRHKDTRHKGTQHKDTRHKDTQHKDTQHKDTQH